ncbi:MAG: hypothetical protein ACKV2U_32585 [Bryobacteraceae bacterium]
MHFRDELNNLGKDQDLAIIIHETIWKVRSDGWRGIQAREQAMKRGLFLILNDIAEVERTFLIIQRQPEY